MGNQVQETYSSKAFAANATAVIFGTGGGNLGGFLATVSGSLKLTVGTDGTGATLVDTCPVTAGVFLPIPLSSAGAVYATLTGGAAGTFFYN